MGLLDQLFADDPTRAKINVNKQLSAAARTQVAVASSIIHLINGGVFAGSLLGEFDDPESLKLSAMYKNNGALDLSKLVDTTTFIRSRIAAIDDQFAPPELKETADYVLSGGMKSGTRCIIRITPAGSRNSARSIRELFSRDIYARSPGSLVFDKFSVESVNEPDEERYQIVETMSADFLYAFGRRPRIIMMTGTVLNGDYEVVVNNRSFSMDWKNAFQRVYEKQYRATNLLRNGNTMLVSLQDTIYEGYCLNLVSNTAAHNQALSQVTITFVLKRRVYAGQNDDRMPGVSNNGLVVPSKRTPEDLFPEAALEDFFRTDAKTIIQEQIDIVNQDIDQLSADLGSLIGQDSFIVEQAMADWVRSGASKQYIRVADNILGHPFLSEIPDFTSTEGVSLSELADDIALRKDYYIKDYYGEGTVFSTGPIKYWSNSALILSPPDQVTPENEPVMLHAIDRQDFVEPIKDRDGENAEDIALALSWEKYPFVPSGSIPEWSDSDGTAMLMVLAEAQKIYDEIAADEAQYDATINVLKDNMDNVNTLANQLGRRMIFIESLRDRLEALENR